MFCPGRNGGEDSLFEIVKPGPTVVEVVLVTTGVVISVEVNDAIFWITVPWGVPEFTLTSIHTSPVVCVVALPIAQVTPVPADDPGGAAVTGPVETKVVSGGTVSVTCKLVVFTKS